jgi:hypothetical protein
VAQLLLAAIPRTEQQQQQQQQHCLLTLDGNSRLALLAARSGESGASYGTIGGAAPSACAHPPERWHSVYRASFEGTRGAEGWSGSDASPLGVAVCGRLGTVLAAAAPRARGAGSSLETTVVLGGLPHARLLVGLDLLAANWSGVRAAVSVDNATVWDSRAPAAAAALPPPWSNPRSRLIAGGLVSGGGGAPPAGAAGAGECGLGAADRPARVAVLLPHHTGDSLRLRVDFWGQQGGGGGGGGGFAIDSVRVAVPESAPLGEVGTVGGGGAAAATVRLRNHYRRPVLLTSVSGAPNASVPRARLVYRPTGAGAEPRAVRTACAVAGFYRCGRSSSCAVRGSCWLDLHAACAALGPPAMVMMESCAGSGAGAEPSCVPRGACRGEWSVSLQRLGTGVRAAAHHPPPIIRRPAPPAAASSRGRSHLHPVTSSRGAACLCGGGGGGSTDLCPCPPCSGVPHHQPGAGAAGGRGRAGQQQQQQQQHRGGGGGRVVAGGGVGRAPRGGGAQLSAAGGGARAAGHDGGAAGRVCQARLRDGRQASRLQHGCHRYECAAAGRGGRGGPEVDSQSTGAGERGGAGGRAGGGCGGGGVPGGAGRARPPGALRGLDGGPRLRPCVHGGGTPPTPTPTPTPTQRRDYSGQTQTDWRGRCGVRGSLSLPV